MGPTTRKGLCNLASPEEANLEKSVEKEDKWDQQGGMVFAIWGVVEGKYSKNRALISNLKN